MPSVEAATVPNEETQAAPATKATIGIIYPPPEVRNIVDKTASFVARNGPEFESRIRQNELNNPKFNFLNSTDPYHNYYKHKVKEFVEGRAQEPSNAPKSGLGFLQQRPIQEQIKIIEAQVPKEPPPEFEFIADPPSISAFDLDVVKLTAQFVARNGRQFLTNLMNREQRNYQFDFLRPQHSLFNYFTKLVEQYTKILIPPKDLLAKLRKETDNPKTIFEQAKYRVDWAKHQERERKREEEEKEKERVAYASIDWHDFVVVETVDYQPNETGNLPPPTTPDEVGARLIAQERYEQAASDEEDAWSEGEPIGDKHLGREEEEEDEEEEDVGRAPSHAPGTSHGADTQVQDMEEASDTESEGEGFGDRATPPPRDEPRKGDHSHAPPPPPVPRDGMQPPPLPPNPEQVIIRRDYNPKAPKVQELTPAPDQFLISPITGEKIPADKIQEHMRIGLLDPRWIDQRDRSIQEKREQEEVYAPGGSVASSLKHLAERRTDIFGSGAEETQIGKKIGEEEKKEKSKVIWDGHTASMEKVAQKARENITIEDQIAVIHKVKGLLPDEEKEKIGPAMPKGGPENVPLPPTPSPQQQRPSAPSIPPPVARPPLPPTTSAPTSMPPVPRPPQPVRPPTAPMPPRPPMVGGIMAVPVHSGPPVMMMAQPPSQPPHGSVMGIRPPMPPMVGPPMPRPPFIPGPPMMPQMGQSMSQMQQPPPPQPVDDDEPPSKKAKTEEQLIPEKEFLQQNQSPVTFRVQIPNMMDRSEWKLIGQTFAVTLPLTDTVSVIKAKIFDEVGMPAGKQKLQLEGMFMKDSNTLAFYNFNPSSTVQLQLKERGGRKK